MRLLKQDTIDKINTELTQLKKKYSPINGTDLRVNRRGEFRVSIKKNDVTPHAGNGFRITRMAGSCEKCIETQNMVTCVKLTFHTPTWL